MSASEQARCTGRIAAVRGESAASTARGSRQYESGSMSAKTGTQPAAMIPPAVPTNV